MRLASHLPLFLPSCLIPAFLPSCLPAFLPSSFHPSLPSFPSLLHCFIPPSLAPLLPCFPLFQFLKLSCLLACLLSSLLLSFPSFLPACFPACLSFVLIECVLIKLFLLLDLVVTGPLCSQKQKLILSYAFNF